MPARGDRQIPAAVTKKKKTICPFVPPWIHFQWSDTGMTPTTNTPFIALASPPPLPPPPASFRIGHNKIDREIYAASFLPSNFFRSMLTKLIWRKEKSEFTREASVRKSGAEVSEETDEMGECRAIKAAQHVFTKDGGRFVTRGQRRHGHRARELRRNNFTNLSKV